jgi:hypothetical protein
MFVIDRRLPLARNNGAAQGKEIIEAEELTVVVPKGRRYSSPPFSGTCTTSSLFALPLRSCGGVVR